MRSSVHTLIKSNFRNTNQSLPGNESHLRGEFYLRLVTSLATSPADFSTLQVLNFKTYHRVFMKSSLCEEIKKLDACSLVRSCSQCVWSHERDHDNLLYRFIKNSIQVWAVWIMFWGLLLGKCLRNATWLVFVLPIINTAESFLIEPRSLRTTCWNENHTRLFLLFKSAVCWSTVVTRWFSSAQLTELTPLGQGARCQDFQQ